MVLVKRITDLNGRSSIPKAALEVAEGGTASANLEALTIFAAEFTPEQRPRPREVLLKYCALDTWAMVRLVGALRELAR